MSEPRKQRRRRRAPAQPEKQGRWGAQARCARCCVDRRCGADPNYAMGKPPRRASPTTLRFHVSE